MLEPGDWPLPGDVPLLPELLHEAGYNTSLIGKWDLNMNPTSHVDGFFGFDHALHFFAGRYFDTQIYLNGAPLKVTPEYLTTYLGREAVRFVEDQTGPFFLWLSFFAPHKPWEAPAEYVEQVSHLDDPSEQLYMAVIKAMDDEVGRLLVALDQTGQRANTLVIFTSDNGGVYSPAVSNGNYRGWKLSSFDGGLRVPAVVNWPARLRPGHASPQITIHDLFVTLLGQAGVIPPEELPYRNDFWPYLAANSELRQVDDAPLRTIVHDLSSYTASVRRGHYKLVITATDCISIGATRAASNFSYNSVVTRAQHRVSLYDTQRDPSEQFDLLLTSQSHKDTKDELLKIYLAEADALEEFFQLASSPEILAAKIPNLFCWNHERALVQFQDQKWELSYPNMGLLVHTDIPYHRCSQFSLDAAKGNQTLAHWTFQRELGASADSSGHRRILKIADHTLCALPRPGFPTNTAIALIPEKPAVSRDPIDLGSSFSVEIAFMFSSSETHAREIVSFRAEPRDANASFVLGILGEHLFITSSQTKAPIVLDTFSLTPRKLHHAVLVVSAERFRVHHNGNQVISGVIPLAALLFTIPQFVVLGAGFGDLIDEVVLYQGPIAAEESHRRHRLLLDGCAAGDLENLRRRTIAPKDNTGAVSRAVTIRDDGGTAWLSLVVGMLGSASALFFIIKIMFKVG